MVGGTVLIQDCIGQLLVVHFYNVLPGGIRGLEAEPLLRAKFPLGASLRVAEPFYKIFRDGTRGVRVDNPSDIIVVECRKGELWASEEELVKLKKQGDEFVALKKYDAALDVYVGALRQSTDLVPTVLSNRSQAFISLEQWGSALCDAAASLTIRPSCKKTWARYMLAKGKAGEDSLQRGGHEVLATVVNDTVLCTEQSVLEIDLAQGIEHKQAGNSAFQAKDFERAIQHYGKSLASTGGTVQKILSNWALCALKTGCLLDVVATSCASLRIGVHEKSMYRLSKAMALLGAYDISIRVAELSQASSMRRLRDEVCKAKAFLSSGTLNHPFNRTSNLPSLLVNWTGPVETFVAGLKGRGLRATRNVSFGQILIIQQPIAAFESSLEHDKFALLTTSQNSMSDTSVSLLKATLVYRTQRDFVLSRIVGCLSDGSTSKKLVPLSDLLLNLDLCSVLLPVSYEYHGDAGCDVTADVVQKIVDINIHGQVGLDSGSAILFPAVAMINHARTPNAGLLELTDTAGSVALVVACQNIKAGDEIFMSYHPNENVVMRKWGISS